MTNAELIAILQVMDPEAQARIWTRVFDHDVSWPVDGVRARGERPGGGHEAIMIHGTPR